MRVIEKKMIEAIRNRKNMSLDNTVVKHGENTSVVFLHNHPIAVFIWADNTVAVSNCGWATVTTKSRLNAILRTFANTGIHQSNFVWYMGDNEFHNGTRVPMTQPV
jgi:hypothetical protein